MRSARAHALILLSYALTALVITWPLVTVLTTRLAGHPFGDAYEYIRHIWWFRESLRTGQPLFIQPLLAYPDGLSAWWLWAAPLQSFPAWLLAFGLPLPAAFNLQILLTLALNGWAACLLAREFTTSKSAAWLSGLAFMTFPAFQGQLGAAHTGLLAIWGLPLYARSLLRLQKKWDWRGVAAGALLLVVSLLGSPLMLVYGLLPVTGLMLATLAVLRRWKSAGVVLLTVTLGLALALIFLLPALAELTGQRVLDERGDVFFSADLLAPVTPSFMHPLYGRLDYPHRILGIDPFERAAFIGLVGGVLALIGLWKAPLARWWLVLGLTAWLLALGPLLKVLDVPVRTTFDGHDTLVPMPWALAKGLPILNVTRTPARFNFTLALATAAMIAYGADVIFRYMKQGKLARSTTPLAAALGMLMVWDTLFFWNSAGSAPQLPTISGEVPSGITALEGRDDIRAVFDIPWDHPIAAKEGLFLQTGHGKPLIAGYVARTTPVDPARLDLLQATLNPALLEREGADIIILHKEWDDEAGGLDQQARSRLGTPLYEDEAYAVFARPEVTEPSTFQIVHTGDSRLERSIEYPIFAAEAGWALLRARLDGQGRTVTATLNQARIGQWAVDGTWNIEVPLWLGADGYHTLVLAPDPPCPREIDPALRCMTVEISHIQIEPVSGGANTPDVQFGQGVTLRAARLTTTDVIEAWLDWRFEQGTGDDDVRYVHVVDERGRVLTQSDVAPGKHEPRSGLAEVVRLALPANMPAGTYRVLTGWYTYPELKRFSVLSENVQSVEGSLLLGDFER